MPDATRFLCKEEVLRVLQDLKRRAKHGRTAQATLIIFRLACCCGLRRGEISGLKCADLVLAGPRPCIIIRKENTKGRDGKRRARKVPLWWDAGTYEDIKEWVAFRKTMGATADAPVVCGVSKCNRGRALSGGRLAARWKTAIRCLGPERVGQLSIHCGRHSFASLAFDAGHSALEVQEALGHKSVHTTSIYLHACPRDVPDVFAA